MLVDFHDKRFFVVYNPCKVKLECRELDSILRTKHNLDIFDGNFYITISKDNKTLQVTYWEKNGFCTWRKKIFKDSFPKPRDDKGIKEINFDEFKMLLEGIDFFRKHESIAIKNFY